MDRRQAMTGLAGLAAASGLNPQLALAAAEKPPEKAMILRKIPSKIANRLIARITGVHLQDYGCSLKAFRATAIKNVRLYGEMHRFIPSLARDAGARITEVPVRHHARTHGVSKYGIDRTFRVILDLIFIVFFMRFRQRPLHAFGGMGLWLATPGFLILCWLLVEKIMGESIGGRPLLMAGVMLVLMGMQFIAAGLIGELLTRIYYESGSGLQYYAKEYAAVEAVPESQPAKATSIAS